MAVRCAGRRHRALRRCITGILQAELPIIPPSWYDQIVAASRRVDGLAVDPLEISYGISKLRWAGRLVAALLLVSAITFGMAEALPGDQAHRVATARYDAEWMNTGLTERVRQEFGLDRPGHVRLLRWLATAATGELGARP